MTRATADTTADSTALWRGGERRIRQSLGAGALGLALFLVALLVDREQALASYLIAYSYVVTIVLGWMAFVMAAHAMNAGWPVVVRRLAEAGIAVLPCLALLYLPLLLSTSLYPWAHPERIADRHVRELVLHKRPVMNVPFFLVRAVFFLAFWNVVGWLLRRESHALDQPVTVEQGLAIKGRLRSLGSALLPLLGITGTFAAFDWLMSLSPDFHSTMYGLYVLSGGFLAALGLLAVAMWSAQQAGHLGGLNQSHWYAMGRLLFAFLIFWAYAGYFQLLIIWMANKPIEARFYLERLRAGDRAATWFLVMGHFVAPWLVLLSYRLKRHRPTVALVGGWIALCHYVDIHWLVGAHRPGGAAWRWQDAPALLLIVGACLACALWRQRGRPLVPLHDPDLPRGLAYESQ